MRRQKLFIDFWVSFASKDTVKECHTLNMYGNKNWESFGRYIMSMSSF